MALWLMINAASGSTSSASIGATYSVVIDRHISDIMSVWNSDELTYEWTPTLQSISQVKTRDMGELSHQQYKLLACCTRHAARSLRKIRRLPRLPRC